MIYANIQNDILQAVSYCYNIKFQQNIPYGFEIKLLLSIFE